MKVWWPMVLFAGAVFLWVFTLVAMLGIMEDAEDALIAMKRQAASQSVSEAGSRWVLDTLVAHTLGPSAARWMTSSSTLEILDSPARPALAAGVALSASLWGLARHWLAS